MCVIMVKKPGIEVPFNLLESACIVNPHGFGVAVADRGKLYVEKMYEKEGNRPEPIAKALEDLKEHQIYLHLRFKTAGSLGEENCHPFQVLNMKEDGMDLVMFHNGTFYEYKDDKDTSKSDTQCFAEQFVTPFYRRIYQTCPDEEILNDPLAAVIMEKFVGASSKVVLLDNYGNDLIVNKSKGKEYEWGWASNDYSFNRTHREPTYGYGHNSWDSRSREVIKYNNGKRTYWDQKGGCYVTEDLEPIHAPTSVPSSKPAEQTTTETKKITPDTPLTEPAVVEANKEPEVKIEKVEKVKDIKSEWYNTPKARCTLEEMEYIDKIEEVCYLSKEDFQLLIEKYPDMALTLFLDMQYYIYEVWEEYGAKDEDEELEAMIEEEVELKEINDDLGKEEETPWADLVSDNMNDPKTVEAINQVINLHGQSLPAIWGREEECSACGRAESFCQCNSSSVKVH